jgi:hypothetical protein
VNENDFEVDEETLALYEADGIDVSGAYDVIQTDRLQDINRT